MSVLFKLPYSILIQLVQKYWSNKIPLLNALGIAAALLITDLQVHRFIQMTLPHPLTMGGHSTIFFSCLWGIVYLNKKHTQKKTQKRKGKKKWQMSNYMRCITSSISWVSHRKVTRGKGAILYQYQKRACKRGRNYFAFYCVLETEIAKLSTLR